MNKTKILIFISALFGFSFAAFSPYGIEEPTPIEPYLNHAFPDVSPSFGQWKVVNAFPQLTFIDPVVMEEVPNAGHYYVGGKQGIIWLIEDDENTSEKIVALDIKDKVIVSSDAGLINFVLHPEFSVEGSPHQGTIFIYYAYHPTIEEDEDDRMNRLSKFKTFENSFEIDPNSEEILIQDYDPHRYHMGGGMFFDNEGFLYLTFGDGGDSNDWLNSSQQIDQRFWGGIIRIDVDNDATRSHPIRRQPVEYPSKPAGLPETFTQGYMIPNDNPWLSESGEVLEEFYGLGLRSPHRATYDAVDEKIWIGDVGEIKREEITVMPKGGNAQWPFKEGKIEGPKPRPEEVIGEEVPPIFDYARSEGISVIGGFVYRGEKWKSKLEGLYLFAEFGRREIWSLNPMTNEVVLLTIHPDMGIGSKRGTSSFATNEDGDIFLLNLFGKNLEGGVIYKLALNDTPVDEIPTLLSQTGAFSDLSNMTPTDGIIPYDVNSPLWSDGASKKRWIALPNDGEHDSPAEQISFFENATWQFPNGTVFIKHFELPIDSRDSSITQKVETRFFILDKNGRGYGLSYKWNETGTDAILLETNDLQDFEILDEMGLPQTQTWEYPSRTECLSCHTANSGFVLGVNTWQLNGDLIYPSSNIESNQLATWNHLGMFSNVLNEDLIPDMPKAVPLSDEFSLQDQVSSYLASNCSHCHQPNGVEGAFDARFSTPMSHKNIINTFGQSRNTSDGEMIVKAGEPMHSQLWVRDNSLDENKMPPLAKTIVDEKYMAVLTEWIQGLTDDCNGTFLSDFEFAEAPVNGDFIGVKKDNSNQSIVLGNQFFEKGLGVNADSKLTYQLNQKFSSFNSYIGVNNDACENATLIFEVYLDDQLKYQSPQMTKDQDGRFISIDVKNANQLTLIVKSPVDNSLCNYGNWADAKLLVAPDSDGDGICDEYDICPGADDKKDENNDGVPDDCERVKEGGTIVISTFPNPFEEFVEILLEQPDPLIQKASIMVYDLQGRLIFQDFNIAYGQKYRLASDWNPGVYIVYAKAGHFKNKIKIVKSSI